MANAPVKKIYFTSSLTNNSSGGIMLIVRHNAHAINRVTTIIAWYEVIRRIRHDMNKN